MTAAGYGWAQPLVRALCEQQHRNIGFCFTADRATRAYILLALRGWEHRASQIAFEQLSHDISALPRRAVLAQLWGADLGPLTPLKHVSGPPWSRPALDELASALSDPPVRALLTRQTKLTPRGLKAITRLPDDARSPVEVELMLRFGTVETRYLIDGLLRQRLALPRPALIDLLRQAKRKADLEGYVHRALLDAPLPPPPWAGTAHIWPLRSMRAIRQTGQLFNNCLVDEGCGFLALGGFRAIYVAELEGRHFCLQLRHDRLFRSWRLTEVKGVKNSKPTPAQLKQLTGAFEQAGFPYLPKTLVELWYE